MPRLNIGDLPLPPAPYRIDKITCREDGVIGFETKWLCRDEDAERARLLRRSAIRHPDVIDAKAAERLARKLDQSSEGGDDPDTLASSLHLGGRRVRVIGWLWMALEGLLP